jgi:hypothetical protein
VTDDPAFRYPRTTRREEPAFLDVASQWLTAFLLALTLIAFFFFATAFQVTSEGTAKRILRRGVAITTDIDAALPRLETELHAAAQTAEGDNVRLPNFPVPVEIPREQAETLAGEELRIVILDQSAERLYEDGMSAWAAGDTDARQDVERFSTAGGFHRSFGLATQKWNTIYLVAAVFFALLSLALIALLWITLKSYGRLLAIGAAVATASVISLAGAVAMRFALRTAETEADPFEQQLIDLGVDTVWLFIRNYLILSMLGFACLGVAAFFLWWEARTSSHQEVRPIDTAI